MAGNYLGSFLIIENEKVSYCNDNSIIDGEGSLVYEVFRLLHRKPLFLNDHIIRLNNSLSALGFEFKVGERKIEKCINKLCKQNNYSFGNIELKVNFAKNRTKIYLGFIPHIYPTPTDYINGVKTDLLEVERDSPNIKQKGTTARQLANKHLVCSDLYEVLLVNSENEITEGSRSNVFFIRNNIVYTAPDNMVLKGVTRKYAIDVLVKNKEELYFKAIHSNDIEQVDAAFICGTSPGILPIQYIGNNPLNVKHPILHKSMQCFNELVQNCIKK